jgi:hypothetical protein
MSNETLRQLYQEHQGKVSDKWALYVSEYDRLLFDFRNREIRLLEIGIQNGGSLEIWAKYFPQAKKLVGCDINLDCHRLIYDDQRIALVVGDANLDDTQRAILSHAQPYDVIIDDGSHRSSDIVKSFARYFSHLADGGIFIAEDLHCSYWKDFEGGLFDPFSSITFFKRLADIVNHEHWGVDRTRHSLLNGFTNHYDVSFDEEALAHIHSIEFINSICVIRKSMPANNESGHRMIVGKQELVQPDVKIFNNSCPVALDQNHNFWSARPLPPDEEVVRVLKSLADRDAHALSLDQLLAKRDAQISFLNQELANRDLCIASLEEQRNILNVELFRLTAESASFGAKIGRGISRLRARIAPVGTRRGTIVSLGGRFVSKLLSFGLRGAASATFRYVSFKFRLKFGQNAIVRKIVVSRRGGNTILNFSKTDQKNARTDRSQLAAWIAAYEPDRDQLAAQKSEEEKFNYKPLLSVIIPIYRVPREILIETLDCLLEQTYSNWQACIVWSDSEDLAGWEWLQEKANTDKRFKIRYLEENGGISRNSNAALELVEGEYVALLDHDDTLTPWAFYEVVKLLQSSPQTDFIYSDKDSITADGHIRLNALFKPEWSPEMLHSVNYLTHLNIMRTRLVRDIGGWNPETDGAQDWDIFFRITEKTQRIARVSSILYHWRILPTSTATGLHAKPYAAMGQLRTQQNHFKRKGLAAAVMPTPEGLFHVKWPLKPASTDVIVYQTGSLAQLMGVVDVLRIGKQDVIRKIYVLHNTSSNKALQISKSLWDDRCVLVPCDGINWRTALTSITAIDDKQTVLLIDGSASSLSENLAEELTGWVGQHPDIAWTSAIALNSDSTVYEAGRVVAKNYQSAPMFHGSPLFSFGWFGGPVWYRNARAASPYAIAMNARDIHAALSGIDESASGLNSFTEFCLALTADGRRGLINPFAKVYFKESPEAQWPNEGKLFHDDPYFSPVFDQVSPLKLNS